MVNLFPFQARRLKGRLYLDFSIFEEIQGNFIENRQFAKITTGVVLSVSPLKIQLTNELILDDSMLAVTWTDETLDPEYVGQTLHLIRQDGGGFYYVLYKKIFHYKRKVKGGSDE